MMIDESLVTPESITINYFNGSDAVIIIDNQLNLADVHCPSLTIPASTANLLDLCGFVPSISSTFVKEINANRELVQASSNDDTNLSNLSDNDKTTADTISNSNSSTNILDDTISTEVLDGDEDDESESELTNLNWLTELKNITNLTPPDLPVTDQPITRFNKFITSVRKSQENYEKRRDTYENNCSEKPPFNYAQIIAMAMLEHGRMTLQDICKWIQEKFAYYKIHKNWNNSIRHNLSLNFFFTKVARGKNEKGKGGYWELAMDTTKSHRKRLRRNRNMKLNRLSYTQNSKNRIRTGRSGNNSNNKKQKKPDKVPPSKSNEIESNESYLSNPNTHQEKHTTEISTNEELLNTIAANIVRQQTVTDATTTIIPTEDTLTVESLQPNEIYFADEIPQCITDDIVVPFFSNNSNVVTIPNDTTEGPNVIVEPVPCFLPTMDTFDENELNGLIDLNEQELIDRFLNCGDEHEIFVN